MYTTFEAGKEQYQLRFTTNSLCEFESKFKIGVIEALGSGQFMALRGLLWAGLQAKQHSVTVDKAGEIIDDYFADDHTFAELTELIVDALRCSGFFKKAGNSPAEEAKE